MKPELLAPAGDFEKLKYAVKYGADAVYFGTTFGSLRNFAPNFDLDQAAQALDYLHSHGKKGYITLNIYPFSEEYPKLIDIAKNLDDAGADAFIVADLGVLTQLKAANIKAAIHVSTQANTTSFQTIQAYRQLGAKRVNLARELSCQRIQDIQKALDATIETEVFIHGSVCFSYSGRCAISDYLTGYHANRGECKHPCRWKYALVEETRPGQYIPVAEDGRGLYLFNSRELALYKYIPALAKANVTSLKIEGRNKSIHYIASIVSFYRQVIDGVVFDDNTAAEFLARVPNRGYSEGFMKGSIEPDDYKITKSESISNAIFVGNILEQAENGHAVLEVRNKIHAGEKLELLKPDGSVTSFKLPDPLLTTKGEQVDFANNSQFVELDADLPPYALLRRVFS